MDGWITYHSRAERIQFINLSYGGSLNSSKGRAMPSTWLQSPELCGWAFSIQHSAFAISSAGSLGGRPHCRAQARYHASCYGCSSHWDNVQALWWQRTEYLCRFQVFFVVFGFIIWDFSYATINKHGLFFFVVDLHRPLYRTDFA